MNKRKFGKKLSRARGARQGLMRSLFRSLILHETIITTRTKAQVFVPRFNKILTKVRLDNLTARREVLSYLGNDKNTLKKLFEIKPEKVRVLSMGNRRGDNAPMVRVSLVVNKEAKTETGDSEENKRVKIQKEKKEK